MDKNHNSTQPNMQKTHQKVRFQSNACKTQSHNYKKNKITQIHIIKQTINQKIIIIITIKQIKTQITIILSKKIKIAIIAIIFNQTNICF